MTGTAVRILLGSARSVNAQAIRMAHGYVINESEKAVQLKFDGGTIWLPKKALQPWKVKDVYKLAPWFSPDGYQCRVLERSEQYNTIGA